MGEALSLDERGPKGRRTNEALVREAAAIASREGLGSLTLGRLAEGHGMSRSGIFAHFGSVENLRLTVLEHARTEFIDSVFTPARTQSEGLPRLYATLRLWLDYLEKRTDAGGCIFLSAIPQWTGAPGPARMRFIDILLALRQELIENCALAVRLGHLRSGVVVEELVAELHAILYGANWSRHALGDEESFALARRSVERCLRMVATPEGVRAAKARRVAPAEIRPVSS